MLQKSTLCALSLLIAAVTAAPAFAEGLGQSGWVKPGNDDYVPSGSFQKFLEGQVSQQNAAPVDGMDGGAVNEMPIENGMSMNQMPMNNGMNMNQMPMNSGMGANQMPMNGGMSMNQMPMNGGMSMNQMPMNGGMGANQMPMNGGMSMNQMPMNNGMAMNQMSMQGAGGGDAGVDGIGAALSAAAAIGLGAQTAMNSVGDAMRGMGFCGGFRGNASGASNYCLSPFGGTGLGYHGPGRLGGGGGDVYTGTSGGGGGTGTIGTVSRTVNRALDRNINYAADQATNRLIYGLWR
jgi:hypothetical protein